MTLVRKPMKAIASEKVPFDRLPKNLKGYFASGKIDGFRCTIQGPEWEPRAYTNSLKLHTNKFVQQELSHRELLGLDGELVVGDNFHACSGDLRRFDQKPDFTFWVFDLINHNGPFEERLKDLTIRVNAIGHPRVKLLTQYKLSGDLPLQTIHDKFVRDDFEGVCIRDPKARYKEGRSSAANPQCIKFKHFEQAEATIVDWGYLERNHNEQKVTETGHLKRSSSKDGKETDTSRMGYLELKSPAFRETFRVGSGFSDRQRASFLLGLLDKSLIGKTVLFKYQAFGSTKDRPRIPIFVKIK